MYNNVMKQNAEFQITFGAANAPYSAASLSGNSSSSTPQTGLSREGPKTAMSATASIFTPQANYSAERKKQYTGKNNEPANSRRRRDPRSGKQYELDIDSILSGKDQRTTIMIQNIPNNYTQQMLLNEINSSFQETYDFFYLPMDYKNKCNIGYSFINFLNSKTTARFFTEFNNRNWSQFKSHKICAIKYGRIQGKTNLIQHFLKTNVVRGAPESYRPMLFYSEGPNIGKSEPFPMT